MALDLHPDCEKRLAKILAAELRNATMSNGQLLNIASMKGLYEGDKALPEAIRKHLAESVSEFPFSTFVMGSLSRHLRERFDYEQESVTVKLVDCVDGSQVHLLEEAILRDFKSLPWEYTLLYPLGLQALEDDLETTHKYPFTDSASLITPGRDFGEEFPLVEGGESLSFLSPLRSEGPVVWERESYYLRIDVSGFIEDFFSTRPIEEASLLLRTIAGLLLSCGAVTLKSSYSIVPLESPFFTYLKRDDKFYLRRSHMLASEYSEKIRSLIWTETTQSAERERTSTLRLLQKLLRVAFNGGVDQDAVRRAGHWYFDSECGGNELLQFVQATVVLEILLGDKRASDVLGIAELLANRCAYSLARSHVERAKIMREVRELYDTRSQILHRGKRGLTREESDQLNSLRDYCKQIISREMILALNASISEATNIPDSP